MTKKQILAVVGGIGVVIVVCAFVYQQFNFSPSEQQANPIIRSEEQSAKQVMVPVPDTIDSISTDIESETTLDMSALDEEVTSETNGINEDSASVNNFETSYDENNL